MKITNKINILTTAWMLCILIIINTVVFFLFMKTTIDMEQQLLFQKTDDILKELHAGPVNKDINVKLKDYLINHSYIRILDSKGKIQYQVTNDLKLAKKIKGRYAKKNETVRRLITTEKGEEQVLIVRVPINNGTQLHSSLEIGEALTGLELRKDKLLWILGVGTILAAILSLLGGKWLSSIIMKPISNMIRTMEDIERSGILKKIIIQNETKDELQTMANTFNRMINRLEENFQKQQQFVSDSSHELKTPLTVIKSYANLLRRHGIENHELADEAIQAIHSEATRIQKMTETFLQLASLEKERALEINEVNLVSLCQNILKQLKDVYRRDMTLNFTGNPIIVKADEMKLKQAIIIILDNAIKYSNDKIEVFLAKNEKYAVIRVQDYGIGIPPEEIEKIFERFYRVDKARSRETGGSGLGLNIARSIMKLHKGEITIKSNEGSGTVVELHLPK